MSRVIIPCEKKWVIMRLCLRNRRKKWEKDIVYEIKLIVEKFKLTNAKKVYTPMEHNAQFTNQQCTSTLSQTQWMEGVPYAEAIGSVLWPTVRSRPDMAYAVGVLSQFIQNLGPVHWEGVKRILAVWRIYGSPLEEMQKHSLKSIATQIGLARCTVTQYWVSHFIMDPVPYLGAQKSRI